MNNDFPSNVFELLQRQMATMGRIGATRFVTSPAVATVAASGGISNPVTIRWPEPGIALCMYGQTLDATAAALAGTGIRLQPGANEEFVNDGQGSYGFLSFQAAFGGVSNWTPIMRRVQPGVDWVCTFRNRGAAVINYPEVTFAMISNTDLAKMG